LVHISEEPHYQLPSGEPVPPPPPLTEFDDRNTYDIPRSIEPEEIVKQGSSDDFIVTTEEQPKMNITTTTIIDSSSPVAAHIDRTMPHVDIDESSTKGSYTLPVVSSSTIEKNHLKRRKKRKNQKQQQQQQKQQVQVYSVHYFVVVIENRNVKK